MSQVWGHQFKIQEEMYRLWKVNADWTGRTNDEFSSNAIFAVVCGHNFDQKVKKRQPQPRNHCGGDRSRGVNEKS